MMDYPPNHKELLSAIQNGQIERVKQLLESGINLNTVLHSPTRREHATILGTAALEGQLEIIEYLISLKVIINFQDPCLSRNALHWAVAGGSFKTTEKLLRCGININCKDRDNVTPIIQAAIVGKKDIVGLLITHGADINMYDRLHSSALHYASFHGNSDIVALLIGAGCIQNNPAIFGQGTPLANLVYHGDVENCKRLVDSGYNMCNDLWIRQYDFARARTCSCQRNIEEYLKQCINNPLSLLKITRFIIRDHFKGIKLAVNIKQLPLPVKLITYILLE